MPCVNLYFLLETPEKKPLSKLNFLDFSSKNWTIENMY